MAAANHRHSRTARRPRRRFGGVINLTQPLSEQTPVLVLPEPFANTPPLSRRTLSRFDDAGAGVGVGRARTGRAHRHALRRADPLDQWQRRRGRRVRRVVGPAVVIDRSAEVADDPGYLLTVADIEAFEGEHGEIGAGSWVLFRTGWAARAHDAEAFLNAGPEGPVTPGPDADAARWLATERGIVGSGVETVGTDAGAAFAFDPPFPAHQFLLGNGRYGKSAQIPQIGSTLHRHQRDASRRLRRLRAIRSGQ